MADLRGVRLLLFRVADLTGAVEVSAVREIADVPKASRIPGADAAVIGLVNMRGDLFPLVDGRRLLGLTGEAPAGERAMVLLGIEDRQVGVVVDAVLDLCAVPPEDLADRDELPGIDPQLVQAVGRREGAPFVLLDLDALLGPILTT